MSSPNIFFADTGVPFDNTKRTSGKVPDNPLQGRPQPSYSTVPAVGITKTSTSDAGLRQRRPLEPKMNTNNGFLPPKSSLSLHSNMIAEKTPTKVSCN